MRKRMRRVWERLLVTHEQLPWDRLPDERQRDRWMLWGLTVSTLLILLHFTITLYGVKRLENPTVRIHGWDHSRLELKTNILRSIDSPRLMQQEENEAFARVALKAIGEKWTQLVDIEKRYGETFNRHNDVTKEWILGHHGILPVSFREKRFVYFITPTYRRTTQMLDLIRVSQALQLASLKELGLVFWVVVEDAEACSLRVRALLERSGLPFAHLHAHSNRRTVHRGIAQRNRAIQFILKHSEAEGVVYFADDDNAYRTEIISELTSVKRVGVGPVGFPGGGFYERCSLNVTTGKVDVLYSNFNMKRRFAVDMAGFAAATWLVLERRPFFNYNWPQFHLESRFIAELADSKEELEPMAGNCTNLLVWHVRTAGFRTKRIESDTDEPYERFLNLTG